MADNGRNELCPCGSGRKFRKCHGAEVKKSGVPAWLFFLVLAILGAGIFYYISTADRGSGTVTTGAYPPPAPVSSPVAASPAGSLAANTAGPLNTASTPLNTSQTRFENLPGFPLTGVSASQKQKFLDRVNSENCTCGCKGDTIAKCVVQDPSCQIAPAMATRILAEIQATAK